MISKILIELLLKIHFYYPIGLPLITNDYPGYTLITEKVKQKIDHLTNNDTTTWSSFLKDAGNLPNIHDISDCSYLQFPSYSLEIELEKIDSNNVVIIKKVIVNLSMLTEYYTIFFQDDYQFKEYEEGQFITKNRRLQLSALYFDCQKNKEYFKIVDSIKKLLKEHFPQYNFVNHSLLFNTLIEGGCPYNRANEFIHDESHKFSIYEFLFSNNIDRELIHVLD